VTTPALPPALARNCAKAPERLAWLARLPGLIEDSRSRWSLVLGVPFVGDDVSCAWVAPAVLPDAIPAVLKLAMPHMEGRDEIAGLRFWDGSPTVRLVAADETDGAMLLERCEPGTSLRARPEHEQDVVMAGLLRWMWRRPPPPHPFRPLSELTAYWRQCTVEAVNGWNDAGLVREGLRVFDELSQPSADDVLLATDLHAGNVLQAQREPWLVIDPKPFVGGRAFDATQHLLNCRERLLADPEGTIQRFADLLELDDARVRLWLFARAAAEPRDEWREDWLFTLARRLAC
jgi:streptomycin 6-kinase